MIESNREGLDDAEEQILACLRTLMRAVDSHSRRLRDEFGLTTPQLFVLRELARRKATTAGELARGVHLGQPTIKVILDRLESHGLVERSRDEEDRRSLRIRLTEEGRQVTERAPPLLHARFREQLALQEDWERSMIVTVLQRIASMMDVDKPGTERDADG